MLAGFEDGRVCRIDPATLAMTEVARLPGKPQWVGTIRLTGPRRRGRLPRETAARRRGRADRSGRSEEGRERAEYEVPCSVVHDLGSGKTYPLDPGESSDRRATAFLLDRKHRLWLGADNGEWGGWCSYVDLKAGKVHSVPGLKIDDLLAGNARGWRLSDSPSCATGRSGPTAA